MKTRRTDYPDIAMQIICSLLVLLFVYAAASKLMDFTKFRIELGKSPLVTAFAAVIAWTIPTIEFAIATLLCIPRARLVGLYASFTLMCLFTLYIGYILRFSPYVPCTCGGILQNMSWTAHLIFNSCFIVFAALGVLIYKPPHKAAPPKFALS
jgi:methylamine utilization protein MauE